MECVGSHNGKDDKNDEKIFEVLGIVLLLVIGFWGGFKLGELTQIKKQAEKK